MENKNKLARIVGAMVLPVAFGGCTESLSPVQEQGMYNLMGLGYDYQMQQERNDAIRNSKSEVNVNDSQTQDYDVITLKNGNHMQGKILADKENEITIDLGIKVLNIPKEEIIEYKINN